MGFFGGKNKKPEDEGKETGKVNRPSRRVIAPGQSGTGPHAKPAAPAAPAAQRPGSAPAPAAPAKPGTAPQRPPSGGTARVQRPGQPPTTTQTRPASDRKPAQDDGLIIGGGDAKPAVPQPVQRPKSKEPISASPQLDFAGDLASGARSGPCRTGDGALIEFLVNKAKLLSADQAAQVRAAASNDGLPLDVVATRQGAITEDQLVSALTSECWVPHLKVDKYEIRKKALDTISREDAVHFGVFPVDKLGSLLTLAMVNPLDAETIRVLESKTGLDIKKVVATRTEITQGIEKYYSGQVQAKEGSIGFTQDVEAKSVTQMLSNVAVKDTAAHRPAAAPAPAPAAPAPAPAPAAKAPAHDNIVPEIQDIDDLLSSDEVIAPAIIEPIGIEPIAAEPESIPLGDLEPIQIAASEIEVAEEPALAPAATSSESSLLDLDVDITGSEPGQALEPVIKPAAPKPAPAPAPAPKAAPSAPITSAPIAPSAPLAPTARPAAAPTRPVAPAAPQFVNLVPVMEEEFQHAITHGKAHVFEKWVGLQTRNRIINAVAVESDLEAVLGPLYAHPKRA